MSSPASWRSWRSCAAAVCLAALVGVWQLTFLRDADRLTPRYRQDASIGLCEDMRWFFPFFYHLGLFPVGVAPSVNEPPPTTRARLEAVVQAHPERLLMDFSQPCNTVRYGDWGKIFLFMPAALLRGDASSPSVTPFNVLLFVVALQAVLLAFWREGHAILGVALVVLVGSDPFQLFEVYARDNVFSLPISTALLLLAAHVRFLTGRARIDRFAWGIAVSSGVLLASLREVRTEPALMVVALPFVYLGIREERWWKRLGLVVALAVAWGLTSHAWAGYFERKFEEARHFVGRGGGEPYTAMRSRHHVVWHNLFIGLADFDTELGYRWEDRAAYAYAIPLMQQRYGRAVTWRSDQYYFDQSYDPKNLYRMSPLDFPEYEELVRDKVLGDIRAHPWWYLGILARRIARIMSDVTPASLAVGGWRVGVPVSGWIVVPTLVAAACRRQSFFVRLLLFTLPLSVTTLVIFSHGTTGYAVFHLVTLAVWAEALVEAGRGPWGMSAGAGRSRA